MRYGSNTRYGFPDFPELEDDLLFYAPYNGNETIENNYTGNAISVKGQMPVMSGGVIFRHGINDNYGRTKALQMAQAVTNLYQNPSVETNTTYWANSGAGETITRTYEASRYGSYCIKGVMTGLAAAQGFYLYGSAAGNFIPGVVAGNSYAFSLFAKASVATAMNLYIFWYDAAGVTTGNTILAVNITTDWTRVSLVGVAPALTTQARLYIRRAAALGVAWTLWCDAVQFEAGTFVTPYCDGSLGAGHAWVGAAHASTSTRVVAQLSYNGNDDSIPPTNAGTVACWVYIVGTLAATSQFIIALVSAAATRISLHIINGVLYGTWGTIPPAAISGGAITVGSFHHVAQTFDGATLTLYVDGLPVASGAQSGFIAPPTSSYIGHYGGVMHLNGFIDDLAVWDRCLTAAEILAIKNYGKALGWMPVDYEYTCDDPEYYSVNDVATYVANQDNKANITHMYHYDTSAGVFSTNLMTAALPYNLLPDPMGVGDCLYIGCETALLDSGPFFSTIFDYLGSVTGIEMVWEYYDAAGAAWSAVNALEWDDTVYPPATLLYSFDPMRQGSRSIWLRPRDTNTGLYTLVIGAMNITGYWIRGRITAVPTTTPPPVQTRRLPFAVTWSGAKLPAASAPGDTPGEVQIQLDSLFYGQNLSTNPGIKEIRIGTRSLDRGADFVSHLNFADEQNPTGAACTLVSASASFQPHYCSPTGRELQWAPAAIVAAYTDIAYISLSSPLAEQYWGHYMVFARCRKSGGAGSVYLRLQLLAGTTTGGRVFTSDVILGTGATGDSDRLIGLLRIPEGFNYYRIYLQGITTTNTIELGIKDLALIPCDESFFYADFRVYTGSVPSHAYNSSYLLINELNKPETNVDITNLLRGYDDANIQDSWTNKTMMPFIQVNADQKIFVHPLISFANYRRPMLRLSPRYSPNYLTMRGKS
jgi:hypothetical protein